MLDDEPRFAYGKVSTHILAVRIKPVDKLHLYTIVYLTCTKYKVLKYTKKIEKISVFLRRLLETEMLVQSRTEFIMMAQIFCVY